MNANNADMQIILIAYFEISIFVYLHKISIFVL
jgi:hypothetical protein